jgi:DNA-binding NtrC family response regulator
MLPSDTLPDDLPLPTWIGNGPLDLVQRVADTDSSVLFEGPVGGGKSLLAWLLHVLSRRRRLPFETIQCGAVVGDLLGSEAFGHVRGAFSSAYADKVGRIEAAGDGTLFFDEVEKLERPMQASLNHVLETRRYSRVGELRVRHTQARFVFAINRNPEELVRQGLLNADFLSRMAVVRIRVPSLAEHPQDIPALAQHFVTSVSARMGRPPVRLTDSALERLQATAWVDNVRGLRSLVERLINLHAGETITEEVLRPYLPHCGVAPLPDSGPVRDEDLLRALEESEWCVAVAARRLKCDRQLFYRFFARRGLRKVRGVPGLTRGEA